MRGQRPLARQPARGLGRARRVHARGDLGHDGGQRREITHRRAGGGQHQIGIEALQRVDPLGRRGLFQGLGQGADVGRLALGQRADQLGQPRRAGGFGVLGQAQRGQRRAAGGGQPFARRLHVLVAQPLQRGVGIGPRQRQAAAARHQRRQQPVRRVGHQEEHGMRRRLFQHLEQGVGRHHVQRVRGVQQRHAPAAAVGGGVEPGFQRADLVDADFLGRRLLGRARGRLGLFRALGGVGALLDRHGLGPDAAQVGVVAAGEPGTGGAMAAGQAVLRRLAQQAGGGGIGEVELADAGQAVHQPGVGEALAVAQPGPRRLHLPGQELGRAHGRAATSWRRPASSSARISGMARVESITWMRSGSAAARAW